MTAAEKIQSFASVEELLNEIKKDSQSTAVLNRRYVVRFIMLDNFNLYQEFIKEMTKSGVQIFNLEQLVDANDKDSWITTDALVDAIKSLQGKVVVSPFSEIVRFYKDNKFKALFEGISLFESEDTNTRIYIPLIGLKHRFENFLNTFSRIEESQPVWAVYCAKSQPVEIYIAPNNFPCPNSINCLNNVYEWLVFWKTHAPTERILCLSDTINTYSKYAQPDNIFDIKTIKTAFDFITQFLKIKIDIEYKESDEYFWNQLFLSLIDSKNCNAFSLKTFVEERFNVHKLSTKDLLNKWTSPDSTEFDRWLLKHYYLFFIADNGYLNGIFLDCIDYSALRLFREIALSIFVDTNSKSRIIERNTLLSLFSSQYKLPDSDLSEMKEQILAIAKTDINKAISLCSGRFDFEKELFIGWYKDGKLSLSELKNSYSDFAAYMNDLKLDSWVNAYIQAYKKAKIEDKYTDEIKRIMTDKNANERSFYEWYNSNELELSNELLAKEKPDKVYWIDGFGIEYLSLIKEIITKSNFQIEKLKIAKTGIPSSTDHNKFEDVVKIDALDSYIHNNLYQYPQTICKEIEIVKDIFNNILAQSDETTIAIVSDHGLTALSRLLDSKKYIAKASHEGRYIKLDSEETIEDTDYIRYKNGADNFKVALTHASLNTKPVREVHGGCTPEEILVPFIVISNKKTKKTVEKNAETKQQTESVVSNIQKKEGFEEEELF